MPLIQEPTVKHVPASYHGHARSAACAVLLAVLALFSARAWAGYATPDAAVTELWRALSHEEGAAPDTAALAKLFSDEGVIFGSRVRDGNAVLERLEADVFIERLRSPRPYRFFECELDRSVTVQDRFAAVVSQVASIRRSDQSETRFVGINSVQLYRTDAGWVITSLYYHLLPNDSPLDLRLMEKCSRLVE